MSRRAWRAIYSRLRDRGAPGVNRPNEHCNAPERRPTYVIRQLDAEVIPRTNEFPFKLLELAYLTLSKLLE